MLKNMCLDDVRYAKLMGTTDGDAPHLFSLLREDDGKVWERLNNQREILLYDFTANVGDTLWCGLWADEYHYNIVDSISTEHIGGVDRKTMNLSGKIRIMTIALLMQLGKIALQMKYLFVQTRQKTF
jgi:hypothetical protein